MSRTAVGGTIQSVLITPNGRDVLVATPATFRPAVTAAP